MQLGRYLGDVVHRRPRRLDLAASPGHRSAGRAAAGHARAVDPRAEPRGPGRGAPRRGRRLPAQLADRCRHHGLRQHRRGHAGVLAGPDAAVPVRGDPEGHVPGAATVGPTYRPAWSRRRSTSSGAGARTASSRLPRQLRAAQRRAHLELGHLLGRRPAPDPAGHRARHHPDGDHRPHDPVQPARHPRARLRPHGSGQGPQRAAGRGAPRAAQLDAAGGHRHRAVARHADRRRHPHRDHLQPHRRRQDALRRRSPRATTP